MSKPLTIVVLLAMVVVGFSSSRQNPTAAQVSPPEEPGLIAKVKMLEQDVARLSET